MIEAAGNDPGLRPQQVAGNHRDAPLHPVNCDIVARQKRQIGLQFQSDDAASGHASRQAQARRTAANADIEYDLARFDRDSGSEEDRVNRDARTVARLANVDASTEQRILARRRRRCGDVQRSSSSAAAIMSRAR